MPDSMPPQPHRQVVLLNRRQQPVEIHLGADVHVLPPGARIEITASALQLPQVQRLIAHKALSVAVPAAADEAPDAPAAQREADAAKSTQSRRARQGARMSAAAPTPSRPSKGESE